jgi:hypothetical protein
MFALLLTTLIGCAPQDAKVSGDWFVWLAANSSATVDEDKLDISGATIFECSNRGWDTEKCEWKDGYIGQKRGGYSNDDRYIGGDCRMNNGYCDDNDCSDSADAAKRFDPLEGSCDVQYEDLYLEDIGDIDCSGNEEKCCTEPDVEDFTDDCEDVVNADFHEWLSEDGYYGMTGDLNQWRSEAIINSEGDLQLTVHVDLGDGQDFRFHFTIDPDFEPIECSEEVTDDGETPRAVVTKVDGSNWVDEWSEDEEGYRIYYLNAGAFQVNPNDSDNWWYLSRDMLSGYGFAKFAAEEFSSHPTDYGNYDLDGNGPGFVGVSDHEAPDIDGYQDAIEDLCNSVYRDECIFNQIDNDGDGYAEVDGDCDDATADITPADCPFVDEEDKPLSWQDEMVVMAGASKTVADSQADQYNRRGRIIDPKFQHKIEDNFWRPIDKTVTGLDGWMEVHSSWVRLKHGSEIKDGGDVTGDFQIFYDGAESGSRLLVRGEFKTRRLRADRWGYDVLEDQKRDENNTEYCGGAQVEQ